MSTQNPMSTPEPWTLVSSGYVTDTQPLFEQYCREALRCSGFSGTGAVLDVACGPGTLSLLIHQQVDHICAIDFSPGMIDCFNREIARQKISNINTYLMDGQQLSFADNQFDWAYSIFGLMFFPDRIQGFKEMYRTLKPGGRVAVTSWAPVADSPLMQLMFGAMAQAFPKKPEADSQKLLNLDDPLNFKHEMQQAGFDNVSVVHFDGVWTLTNVEEFFDAMVRGSAPIVMLKKQLGDELWLEKRSIMLSWLHQQIVQVPVTLSSRAYIGIGQK